MKQIPLTKGYVALVDDEDFEWLNQWKWHVSLTTTGVPYAKTGSRSPHPYMHRAVMRVKQREIEVDHIDGNTLNNCRTNLRFGTSQQNNFNVGPRGHNKTGYKGVRYDAKNKRYTSVIRINRKSIWLGSSDCPKTCARTYNQAAKVLFGEFCWLNEVEDGPLCTKPILGARNSSGYRGVYFSLQTGRWCADIVVNKKRMRIGSFSDSLTAARAYDSKAFTLLGEKAKLNFPENFINLKTAQSC
jgi:HNH endonuclease/AP2 domain